ncbi:MAG: hypothetical protein LBD82_04910 [Deltaproteobacteria bacterium]|jgi:hypothetical protein|nr:hypothetical protein [Deltaproteobacteria bacterium]
MPPINLDSFNQTAARFAAADPDRALRLDGDGVTDAGRLSAFFGRNANRVTMDGFIAAIRAKHGKGAGDFVHNMLKNEYDSGKPLTARAAREMIEAAAAWRARDNKISMNIVQKFISAAGPGASLETAMDAICARYNITAADNRGAMKNWVMHQLLTRAASGSLPSPLSPQDLLDKLSSNPDGIVDLAKFRGSTDALGMFGASIPCGIDDRMRLADLGLEGDALFRAMWEVRDIRENIQPQGELSPQTIWRAVFSNDRPPPENLDGAALSAALEDDIRTAAQNAGMDGTLGELTYPCQSMPWARVTELLRRPGILGMDDVPGADAIFNNMGSPELALNRLTHDIMRRGMSSNGARQQPVSPPADDSGRPQPANAPASPAPTFTFVHEDGTGENIQVGRNTNFQFKGFEREDHSLVDAEQDRKAYQDMHESSLSRALTTAVRSICGPDASEAQVSNVIYCMAQNALIPLGNMRHLAQVGFNEHGNVNVSFSRLENGAVRAEFSTDKALAENSGSFSMTLDIMPDGQVEMRAFETRPSRRNITQWHERALAAAMDMNDQSPGSFRAAAGSAAARALGLSDGAPGSPALDESVLHGVAADVENRLRERLAEAAADLRPLDTDEIRQLRDDTLRERLEISPQVRELAAQLPEGRRAAFTRACLETGLTPQEDHLRPIMELASQAATLPRALASARDERAVIAIIDDFTRRMTTLSGPAEGGGPAIIGRIAARMGMAESLGTDPARARSIGMSLVRPHSPFLDALFTMRQQAASSPAAAGWGQTMRETLLPAMLSPLRSVLSEDRAARLDPANISERDLSPAAQRRRRGPAFTLHGASLDVASPNINAALSHDLPALRENIRAIAQEWLNDPIAPNRPNPPADLPNSPDWTTSTIFNNDYPRDAVRVNGLFHHPRAFGSPEDTRGTGTSTEDFIGLFPDRRSAALLSNLVNQNFHGLPAFALQRAMDPSTATSPETRERLITSMFGNGLPSYSTDRHIEVLDAAAGRYRVSGTVTRAAPGNEQDDDITQRRQMTALDSRGNTFALPDLERITWEISLDVTLGDPPTVTEAHLDILMHGWQDAPNQAISL